MAITTNVCQPKEASKAKTLGIDISYVSIKIVLAVISLFIAGNLTFAQQAYNTYSYDPQQLLDSNFGGELQYSVIIDSNFYKAKNLPVSQDSMPTDIIMKQNLYNNDKASEITISQDAFNHCAWTVVNNCIYEIDQLIKGLVCRCFEKNTPEALEIKPLRYYKRSFIDSFSEKGNLDLYYDVVKVGNTFLSMFNYDINSLDSSKVVCCFRDSQALYIYSLDLISENTNWVKMQTYTRIDYNKNYPPLKYPSPYSNKDLKKKAVQDSLFFYGNFKVIEQDKDTYVFNLKTGRIYLLGNKKVELLGTISITDDYPLIKGNKLIVEDQDNGEVIIFALVSWQKTKLSKPKLKIMNKEEMEVKFKHIL